MSSTLFQSGQIQRYKMTLSKQTVNKLADALTLEVIDYILNDPRTNTFVMNMVSEALCEKLGNKNEDGSCSFDSSELAPAVFQKLRISIMPTDMPSNPATL